MRKTIGRLEAELASERRQLAAFKEWFYCENAGLPRDEVYVRVDGEVAMTVRVHGTTRAAGGVCVVESGGHKCVPTLLDDLRANWSVDPSPEVRRAADELAALRVRRLSA